MQSRLVPIAPAVGALPTSPSAEDAKMAFTCVTCVRRKVKCDKTYPVCSTCRKSALECAYQAPAPRKRKRKPVDEMNDRLDHYEKLLKQNGILPQTSSNENWDRANEVNIVTPISDAAEPTPSMIQAMAAETAKQDNRLGRLHASRGKTRYINTGLWRNLPEVDFQPSSEDDDDMDGDDKVRVDKATSSLYLARDPLSSALLGYTPLNVNLVESHPTYESAIKLWEIYVENVDPVCKILHVPSAEEKLKRVASNPSIASKPTEVVLFAVYHIAIISTTEENCQETFHQPRDLLKARYHDAVRQALVNAQFLRTTDIYVVKAYILFLLSVRAEYDPHTFWILTGVAARLGQRLGLHRDGLEQNLNPFDVQMRRRVFWQLLPLDGLAAQVAGTGIAMPLNSWDTQQPLNINDTDIWPGMDHAPKAREGATDMIFCLARTELAKYLQRSSPRWANWATPWDIEDESKNEKQIKDIEAHMESSYIRFCDISDPIHCLTMLMARTSANYGRFRTRTPRARRPDASDQVRREQWIIANKCLDSDAAANSNPLLQRYRWHLSSVFQWEPAIWVLYELQRDPLRYDDSQIWTKIGTAFQHHPDIMSMRRSLHVAVGRLTIKAWTACCFAQKQNGQSAIRAEPSCVETVRLALKNRHGGRKHQNAPPGYNPFNPDPDARDEQMQPTPTDLSEEIPNIDLAELANLNMEPEDWLFWDQLLNDPDAMSLT